jgi:hypothetical protein
MHDLNINDFVQRLKMIRLRLFSLKIWQAFALFISNIINLINFLSLLFII